MAGRLLYEMYGGGDPVSGLLVPAEILECAF
jgi:hypothetical protein